MRLILTLSLCGFLVSSVAPSSAWSAELLRCLRTEVVHGGGTSEREFELPLEDGFGSFRFEGERRASIQFKGAAISRSTISLEVRDLAKDVAARSSADLRRGDEYARVTLEYTVRDAAGQFVGLDVFGLVCRVFVR